MSLDPGTICTDMLALCLGHHNLSHLNNGIYPISNPIILIITMYSLEIIDYLVHLGKFKDKMSLLKLKVLYRQYS